VDRRDDVDVVFLAGALLIGGLLAVQASANCS
jgi:hypothetical protein